MHGQKALEFDMLCLKFHAFITLFAVVTFEAEYGADLAAMLGVVTARVQPGELMLKVFTITIIHAC